MSQITVRKADNNNSLESLNRISNSIRTRALQLSQTSSDANGDATRNWLQAEKDLFNVPEATLSESDKDYQIQVAMPGCDSSDIEVIAMANSVVVRSSSSNSRGMSSSGRIVYSDFDSRMLMRRFDLASSIDTSKVTAAFENGVLSIAAQKSASVQRSSAAGA